MPGTGSRNTLKAGWHERNEERVGFRNGYRVRKSFKAHGFGEIKDFKVPRTQGIAYESKILVKYQRRSIKFDYDLMKIY
ncbi:MAG: transposase, partial [Candidatus Goldbacteria bacterium]|nr:transposase [Candidatus Goldiibacteriota bacterium]